MTQNTNNLAGFLVGAFFVYSADIMMDKLGLSGNMIASVAGNPKNYHENLDANSGVDEMPSQEEEYNGVKMRRKMRHSSEEISDMEDGIAASKAEKVDKEVSWRRILLLIVAITIHNIPEGESFVFTFCQ